MRRKLYFVDDLVKLIDDKERCDVKTAAGVEELHDRVVAVVGPAQVLATAQDKAPYLSDWRDRYHGAAQWVVRPGSTAEVAAVVQLCAKASVPIVSQGGNTGLCGAATPDETGRAVVLRLDRMNRIRDVNATNGTMLVEAGGVLASIQEAAAEAGMLFPLSLGAEGSCQIGGNISTNAGGTMTLRYGPMRDLVLGLEVVLPDGTICDWLTPLRKNTTGYDLKHLFIGAEGTLGIITAATIKVFPRPRQTATAMVALPRVEDALSLLIRMRATLGERLSSFEIINEPQVSLVLRHVPGNVRPFSSSSPWYVLLEATDTVTEYDLSAAVESVLSGALDDGVATNIVIPSSTVQAAALWRLRHSVSEANKHAGITISHDTAVPLHQQSAFSSEVQHHLTAAFPNAVLPMVGHIGDGNIHVVAILDPDRYPEPGRMKAAKRQINRVVDEVTLSLGGTISAEHGIGQDNKARLLDGRGEADVALMRTIKRAIDPLDLMNPGKVFDLVPASSSQDRLGR